MRLVKREHTQSATVRQPTQQKALDKAKMKG